MTPTDQVQYTDKERYDPRTCGVHNHSSFVARFRSCSAPRETESSFYCVPCVQLLRSRSDCLGLIRLSRIAELFGSLIRGNSRSIRRTVTFDDCLCGFEQDSNTTSKLPEFYRGISVIGNSFRSIFVSLEFYWHVDVT